MGKKGIILGLNWGLKLKGLGNPYPPSTKRDLSSRSDTWENLGEGTSPEVLISCHVALSWGSFWDASSNLSIQRSLKKEFSPTPPKTNIWKQTTLVLYAMILKYCQEVTLSSSTKAEWPTLLLGLSSPTISTWKL